MVNEPASHRPLGFGWRRALTALAAFAVIAVGAIGGLHTPAGRRLMHLVGVPCPVLNASPQAVTAARAMGLAHLRGTRPAPARPALGFVLDASRESDIAKWAKDVGADCSRRQRGFVLVTCRASARRIDGTQAPHGDDCTLTADEEITFAFGATGRLIAIDRLRHPTSGAQANRLFARSEAELTGVLGAAHDRAGDLTQVTGSVTPLATALVGFRFSDYLASIVATRLPSGMVIRERLQSAVN